MLKAISKIFGTKNEREIKSYLPVVDKINSLEPGISRLSDPELTGKTDEFRKRIEAGETLDDLLPEAFAVAREASKRALEMRHFDVQLIGGIVLHKGKIAEMKTGEGKTLVATLPVYLNALDGRGVHVVTVNDYLATRDAHWMRPVYEMLGLKVGVIVHGLTDEQRQENYGADITYGTNNEFGFDYLRDNMKYDISQYTQRELNYAIVDEVDSILIDEARTPLIISGPSEESTDKYYKINRIIPSLKLEEHFTLEEKNKSVVLTDEGNSKAEHLLGLGNLYDQANIEIVHHVLQGLRAHHMYKRDVDYVVKDGEVVIVDEFTGRLMPGRRWSDGLHQAIEAKEGVKIENENQTLATITFQNYFRMYNKLAGMTGTADTEAAEFGQIYNLDVTIVPTHRPMIRNDYQDSIYKNEQAKFRAITEEIEDLNKKGQPVLVGTISIEKSEVLSQMLRKKGIPHSVLNAKYHEREAEIISQAGRNGAVTIATNMAGRGTDIILGGNPEGLMRELTKDKDDPSAEELAAVKAKAAKHCEEDKKKVIENGGLFIMGTERHESRRIDNQLRGRSGRQGDPGGSRFYLSLEDDLMRIFGSDRLHGIMNRLGMEEDVPIENRMVSKAVENAQKRVEAHNFDIRKHLIDYDDVMNRQRTEIYGFRREILSGGENLRERIHTMMEDAVDALLDIYCPEDKHATEWDIKGLKDAFYGMFAVTAEPKPESTAEAVREVLLSALTGFYETREKEVGREVLEHIEKVILLQVVDAQWKDHLLAMDHLREGIGLRGYGQRDPLTEYKKEGFDLFGEMTDRINTETLSRLFKVRIQGESEAHRLEKKQRLIYNRGESSEHSTVRKDKKVGRNDPCPCGSGKKYKKCCGANA
ncbi:MAG: preprotein translocase subunit SecA [Nitrospiraceae bacterium]|nr:preprotein translocase subunit SecA [Nitrospiraceae bacterium]